eukprot:scaffold5528_cov27-Tisochrysis_lutea.AAC.3
MIAAHPTPPCTSFQLRDYLNDTSTCRATWLAAAMHQPEAEPPCGRCDNCRWRKKLLHGEIPSVVKGAAVSVIDAAGQSDGPKAVLDLTDAGSLVLSVLALSSNRMESWSKLQVCA